MHACKTVSRNTITGSVGPAFPMWILTVGEALRDGGSRIRVSPALPLNVSFLDSLHKTMVTLVGYT